MGVGADAAGGIRSRDCGDGFGDCGGEAHAMVQLVEGLLFFGDSPSCPEDARLVDVKKGDAEGYGGVRVGGRVSVGGRVDVVFADAGGVRVLVEILRVVQRIIGGVTDGYIVAVWPVINSEIFLDGVVLLVALIVKVRVFCERSVPVFIAGSGSFVVEDCFVCSVAEKLCFGGNHFLGFGATVSAIAVLVEAEGAHTLVGGGDEGVEALLFLACVCRCDGHELRGVLELGELDAIAFDVVHAATMEAAFRAGFWVAKVVAGRKAGVLMRFGARAG